MESLMKYEFIYNLDTGTGMLAVTTQRGRFETSTRMILNVEDAVFFQEGVRDLTTILEKKINPQEDNNAE